MPKSFLIDTTRCTACRGCQVACKEWHDHPANATKQRGTHQNPPDLNPYNFKVVRFREHLCCISIMQSHRQAVSADTIWHRRSVRLIHQSMYQ